MTDGKGRVVKETWACGMAAEYELTDALHAETTPFQAMELVETRLFGRMLLLDGLVQTTVKDEFIYHEMMTHVPIIGQGQAESVLIIGGGDGGILREVLKHRSVKKAVMVEIDRQVIDFSQRLLPTISAGAFDDERTEIVIDDGAKYVANTTEKFDVVIIDSCDPIGPATVLFSKEFYRNAANCLTPDGIMTCQTGSTWMQPDELPAVYRLMEPLFRNRAACLFAVPTYIGGLFSSICCSNRDAEATPDIVTLEKRFQGLEGTTRYYNPGVHYGSFQLPGYVKERL